MRTGYAEQYQLPGVIIEAGDVEPRAVEEYAHEIGAIYREWNGPEEYEDLLVVQFPGRPMELYAKDAMSRGVTRAASGGPDGR